MITGSYPPDICGVGDYASQIMGTNVSKKWELYRPGNWSWTKLLKRLLEVRRFDADTIYMQYPTQGYGWSLVPHFICLYFSIFSKANFILVLHECSQLSAKSQVALQLMLRSANHIIFTNEFEREFAVQKIPRVARHSSIIKIRSNIAVTHPIRPMGQRSIDVLYFGHIRPKKGIETYIETILALKERRKNLRAVLMGQSPLGFESYFDSIREQCRRAGIEMIINSPEAEVSLRLADSKVVYLPFPDGVSERRGSALAAMGNGAIVATTSGQFTTASLASALKIIPPHASHDSILNEILNMKPEDSHSWQKAGVEYLASAIPATWDEVVERYVDTVKNMNNGSHDS